MNPGSQSGTTASNTKRPSEFHTLLAEPKWRDGLYLFLKNVFHLYPEDRFHRLIEEACAAQATDELIYTAVAAKLGTIKPFLAPLRYAIPALAKQKQEMTAQTLTLLGSDLSVNGYVEIGSPGRYVSHFRTRLRMRGDVVIMNDKEPSFRPDDVFERGRLARIGRFVPMKDYAPIAPDAVPDGSIDLVTCYIGLHHAHPARLPAYVQSIARILRPGGSLILRDHDASDEPMRMFASLVHTVFNLGLGIPWTVNAAEPRHFREITHWVELLGAAGLVDSGARLLQVGDPSLNVLMRFRKRV